METRCKEVSPRGTAFELLDAEIAELARLSEDGRDVADIRIERSMELARLRADAGDLETAHELLDELLVELAGRADLRGTWLAIELRRRRAEIHALDGQHEDEADAYGGACDLAAEAASQWPTDRELAQQLVGVAHHLGDVNRALGEHVAAIAAYDTALATCDRFADDPTFLALYSPIIRARAQAMRALHQPAALILEWFDRAIVKHAKFDAPMLLSRLWFDRALTSATTSTGGRADYVRAIQVIEHLLPDEDVAIQISRASHNIALAIVDPVEALPYETRAVELMYDALEERGSDETRYDLLLYRLTRAKLMAQSGSLAAAVEEVRDVLGPLEDVITRVEQERGSQLLSSYRKHLATWTTELGRRTPAVYRTLPPVATIDPASVRCTFCKRARVEVAKMISGPRVFICDRCTPAATAALPARPADHTVECGFCATPRRRVVGTADGVICDDCLDLCRDILEEDIAKTHPDQCCTFCGTARADVERLVLGPDASALCTGCFEHARRFLGRHHPYDPASGQRSGVRALHFDVCHWCQTREALAFLHGKTLVLCDACVDRAAQDMV